MSERGHGRKGNRDAQRQTVRVVVELELNAHEPTCSSGSVTLGFMGIVCCSPNSSIISCFWEGSPNLASPSFLSFPFPSLSHSLSLILISPFSLSTPLPLLKSWFYCIKREERFPSIYVIGCHDVGRLRKLSTTRACGERIVSRESGDTGTPPPPPGQGTLAFAQNGTVDAFLDTKASLGRPVPETAVSVAARAQDVRAVFDHWASTMWSGRGRRPVLDSQRQTKIRGRLVDGYTVADLCSAVDGCRRSEFHMAGGHTDISLICRDAAHVDRFMALVSGDGVSSTLPSRRKLVAPSSGGSRHGT